MFLCNQVSSTCSNEFVNAVHTCIQTSRKLITSHCSVTTVGTVGITSNTAVALYQRLQCLESPIGRLNVRELRNGGNLGNRVLSSALSSTLSTVLINLIEGRSIDLRNLAGSLRLARNSRKSRGYICFRSCSGLGSNSYWSQILSCC